jgi:hypothetical protein
MKSHNRIPRAALPAAILAGVLNLTGCTEASPPSPDQTTTTSTTPSCSGIITEASLLWHGKDSSDYRVTALSKGNCAPLLQASGTEVIGKLAVNDTFTALCYTNQTGMNTTQFRVFAHNKIGDISLYDSLSASITEEGFPPCPPPATEA